MPLYDYQCPRCRDEWETLARVDAVISCDGCRVPAVRQISLPTIVTDSVAAYDDDGLGVRIESRSQRRRVMREKGVEEVGGTQRHGAKGTMFSFPGHATRSVPKSGAYAPKSGS